MAMVATLWYYLVVTRAWPRMFTSSISVERLATLSAQYTAPYTWPTLWYVVTSCLSCLSNSGDTVSGLWGEAGSGSGSFWSIFVMIWKYLRIKLQVVFDGQIVLNNTSVLRQFFLSKYYLNTSLVNCDTIVLNTRVCLLDLVHKGSIDIRKVRISYPSQSHSSCSWSHF